MNNAKLSSLRFWDMLDAALTKKRYSGKRRISLYPSEASVICTDPVTGKKYIEGGCHRKSWYRMMGFKESNPAGTKAQYIFEFGNYLEDMLAELTKRGFVYDNNSVKFWDPATSVSGEIDLIIRHPEGGYIFVEVKSSYGPYKERELFGAWEGRGQNASYVEGSPSTQNLLQLVTYLWNHREDEDLLGGKLVYILRDNMSRIEFDVVIEQQSNGKHRVLVNGKIDDRFYVEDMIDRYYGLQQLIKDSITNVKSGKQVSEMVPPPRDFDLMYSDTRLTEDGDFLKSIKRLSQTKLNTFEKDAEKRPGDFQCGYCSFKDLCWTAEDVEQHLGFKKEKPQIKPRTKTTVKKVA